MFTKRVAIKRITLQDGDSQVAIALKKPARGKLELRIDGTIQGTSGGAISLDVSQIL